MIAKKSTKQESLQIDTSFAPCVVPETIGSLAVGKIRRKVGDWVWVKWDGRYEKVVIMGFYGKLVQVKHPLHNQSRRYGRHKLSPLPPRWQRWRAIVVLGKQAYECELKTRRWNKYMTITHGPPHLIGQTVRRQDVAKLFYLGHGEIDHAGSPWQPWTPYYSYTNARLEAEKYNLQKLKEVDNFLPAQTTQPKQ